jgi:hypothetical protein
VSVRQTIEQPYQRRPENVEKPQLIRAYSEERANPASRQAKKKPFIVDAPASMLKRNEQLSKGARHLYMTMRALADGKTGELKINGRWLRATAIESAAEIGRDARLRYMRELVAMGFVTRDFERVLRFIGGRRRMVRGRTQYKVHREASISNADDSTSQKPNVLGEAARKIVKNPNILLKSISSTVEEIDSQEVSNPPTVPVADKIGYCDVRSVKPGGDESSSPAKNADKNDDDSAPLHRNSPKKHKEEAKARLLEEGHSPQFVDAALDCIEERAGSDPNSANFYILSFRKLIENPRDKAKITAKLEARVGSGPETPEPTFCAVCGHTKSFHKRKLENKQRDDPRWNEHEFVELPSSHDPSSRDAQRNQKNREVSEKILSEIYAAAAAGRGIGG